MRYDDIYIYIQYIYIIQNYTDILCRCITVYDAYSYVCYFAYDVAILHG